MLSYKIAFLTSKGIGSSNIQSHHKSIPIPTPSIPLNNTKQLPAPNSMHSEFWWVQICFPSLNIGWWSPFWSVLHMIWHHFVKLPKSPPQPPSPSAVEVNCLPSSPAASLCRAPRRSAPRCGASWTWRAAQRCAPSSVWRCLGCWNC